MRRLQLVVLASRQYFGVRVQPVLEQVARTVQLGQRWGQVWHFVVASTGRFDTIRSASADIQGGLGGSRWVRLGVPVGVAVGAVVREQVHVVVGVEGAHPAVQAARTLVVDDLPGLHGDLVQAVCEVVDFHLPGSAYAALSDVHDDRSGVCGLAVDMRQQSGPVFVTAHACHPARN